LQPDLEFDNRNRDNPIPAHGDDNDATNPLAPAAYLEDTDDSDEDEEREFGVFDGIYFAPKTKYDLLLIINNRVAMPNPFLDVNTISGIKKAPRIQSHKDTKIDADVKFRRKFCHDKYDLDVHGDFWRRYHNIEIKLTLIHCGREQ
jgi:hypothetical protein